MISRLLNHFVQTDTELQKNGYPEKSLILTASLGGGDFGNQNDED